MDKPQVMRGYCQCGESRVIAGTNRIFPYLCHCTECRRQSASAYGFSVAVSAENIEVAGPISTYERRGASGNTTQCFFCPKCGTRLYHQSFASPDLVTAKGGIFEVSETLAPRAHLWTRSKLPWVVIPTDLEVYDTQPADLTAWRRSRLN